MSEDQFEAEIKVPKIAGAGAELSIGRWFKQVGDPVTEQQPLVEIDTDNENPNTGYWCSGCCFGERRRVRRAGHIAGHY